jgi:hypothetical protein
MTGIQPVPRKESGGINFQQIHNSQYIIDKPNDKLRNTEAKWTPRTAVQVKSKVNVQGLQEARVKSFLDDAFGVTRQTAPGIL